MYLGPESTPYSRGITVSNELAEELRVRAESGSEVAGELETYVLSAIFEGDPAEAVGVYEGMVTSPDSRVRTLALDGILNLRSIAPDKATYLLVCLMTDDDRDIKERAKKIAWPE